MDEKPRSIEHFNAQWGEKFRSLNNFTDTDFIKHLLTRTLTTADEWKGKTVFEGGCGNGRNTFASLQLGINWITATDLSAGGVNATIENTKEYKNVGAYQTSLTELKKEYAETYDIVFSVNCIPHISNYKDALREMVRICKQGGLILFNVPPVRDRLVADVDRKIREHSTKMCPKCLELFSRIMVDWSKKPEISRALRGKMEISGDLLSAYDHFGLPYTQEFTKEQIIKDMKELGCEILDMDANINVKARKL